jgi:4a-hydroxytetrahydrobiopterin dehydratase
MKKSPKLKNNWKIEENKLVKEFKFNNFSEAINFVNKILPIAEETNHHPDLLIHSYKQLKVILFTHEEEKITEKDYSLAKKIDEIE